MLPGSPEDVLAAADARGDMVHGLLGERERHEVVEVRVIPAVAQVLAVVARADFSEKDSQFLQKRLIERRIAAEIERQPVTYHGHAIGDGAKLAPAAAADTHPVLRRNFHELDECGTMVRERVEMDAPQTKPCTGYGIVVGHDCANRNAGAVTLFS